MRRWQSKHPTPYDFFFTLNHVSGQNMDWLIRPWFYEFGYVDLSINDVVQNKGRYIIRIENRGKYPVPLHMKIMFEDGSDDMIIKNASIWKKGNTDYTIERQSIKKIKSIELIDKCMVDVDLSNNLINYQMV